MPVVQDTKHACGTGYWYRKLNIHVVHETKLNIHVVQETKHACGTGYWYRKLNMHVVQETGIGN